LSYTISNCRWQTVKGAEWKELLLFRDDKRLPSHTNTHNKQKKKPNSQLHILTGTFFWVTTQTESSLLTPIEVIPTDLTALKAYSVWTHSNSGFMLTTVLSIANCRKYYSCLSFVHCTKQRIFRHYNVDHIVQILIQIKENWTTDKPTQSPWLFHFHLFLLQFKLVFPIFLTYFHLNTNYSRTEDSNWFMANLTQASTSLT